MIIAPLVVQRNSDLPGGHPEHVYKGRNDTVAIFDELSSRLARLEASNIVDSYGLAHRNGMQQCDGTQSYTQATLGTRPSATTTMGPYS